jgi:hypothetical protein
VVEAAEQFLAHLRRETRHREFTERELEVLEADLAKLQRWYDQVRGRDHFAAAAHARAQAVLGEAADALARYLDETFARAEASG